MPNEFQNGDAEFGLLREARWLLLGMTLYSAYLYEWGISPDMFALAGPLQRIALVTSLVGCIVTTVAFLGPRRHAVPRQAKLIVLLQAFAALAVIGTGFTILRL